MDESHIMPMDRLKALCHIKGISPMQVIGTRRVQLGKTNGNTLEPISWEEFEARISERGLAVYSKNGWIKIMKDTRQQ